MRSSLRAIQTALRGGRYETALLQTQGIVEQLYGLRTRDGFNSTERHASIQDLIVQLAKLRNKLEQKVGTPETPLSISAANNLLADMGTTLSGWGEELRFTVALVNKEEQ